MIPGVGKALKDVDMDNSIFNQTEAIIKSMTPFERQNPSCLNASRKQRIAGGCGCDVADINRLIKQFDQMRSMMKGVATGKMPKMPAGRR